MSQHTKGPWGAMSDGPVFRINLWQPWQGSLEAAPGLTIGSPHNTEMICRVSGYLQPVVANARLISLAPEMYDLVAYVAMHRCQHPDEPGDCHYCAARAIVRKAEGKS